VKWGITAQYAMQNGSGTNQSRGIHNLIYLQIMPWR